MFTLNLKKACTGVNFQCNETNLYFRAMSDCIFCLKMDLASVVQKKKDWTPVILTTN